MSEAVLLRRVPVRMFLPESCERVTPVIRREREWEPGSTDWFLRNIRRGNTFVDVGAHAGYYTLIAAKVVGELGRVFAFEPDPSNCAALRKNVEENGFRNVTVEQAAVADLSGRRRLYLNPKNTGDHRITDFDGCRSSLAVEVVTLDDYFRGCDSRVDLVKIDTQGAEIQILTGARRLIAANRPRLLVEFWPYGLARTGGTGEELLAVLESYGYGPGMAEREGLLARCTVENRRHVNLMLDRVGFEVPA